MFAGCITTPPLFLLQGSAPALRVTPKPLRTLGPWPAFWILTRILNCGPMPALSHEMKVFMVCPVWRQNNNWGISFVHIRTLSTWFSRVLGGMPPFFVGTVHHFAILGYTQSWTNHDRSVYPILWLVSPKSSVKWLVSAFFHCKIPRKSLNPIESR